MHQDHWTAGAAGRRGRTLAGSAEAVVVGGVTLLARTVACQASRFQRASCAIRRGGIGALSARLRSAEAAMRAIVSSVRPGRVPVRVAWRISSTSGLRSCRGRLWSAETVVAAGVFGCIGM